MSYRPEGWKTEKVKQSPLHCFAPQECADHFFEAGADAMLEALRKNSMKENEMWDFVWPFQYEGKEIKGRFVFIPDD